MYDFYATGATLEEVGDRFGLTRERVRQIFDEAELPTRSLAETHALRHDRVVQERSDEICAAFSESRDTDDVARKLNVPHAIVKEIVSSHFPPAQRRRRRRPPKPRYPTTELIDFLREADGTVSGALTAATYDAYAKGRRTTDGRVWPCAQTHGKRFGSWRKALQSAGVEVNTRFVGRSRRTFSDEDCIQALREAAQIFEKVPTATAYNDLARASHGKFPSAMTIIDRFGGTWHGALARAGL